eukprot:5112908-Prorocentrum_lima.AAC.1
MSKPFDGSKFGFLPGPWQILPIVIVALVVGQHSVVASEVVLQVVVVDLLDVVDLVDLVPSQ